MIQVKRRNSFYRIITLSAAFLLTLTTSLFAQDTAGDAVAGEALFKSNCGACHKLYKPMTGPALYNVVEKYDGDYEWLYKWIKNSQALIKSGDARAVQVYEENGKKVMNAFPALSNADIDNILAYTNTPQPAPPEKTIVEGEAVGGGVSNNIILGVLALVFVLLVAVLFLVNNTLKKFATAQGIEVEEPTKRTPIWKAFVQNQFLVLVTSILLLLGSAYFAYGALMSVGVEQGYAPIQPIHYSHRIHAGENAIECKYCHSSARVSKHSGIPSLNVCMNCHKSIAEVAGDGDYASVTEDYSKEFYDGEIQKLYKAVGWDPATQSYTGETQPVEWVRIHNLPDFAYFNHSQHVTVAGIECQKCHGPVEEMEVMYQYAPLTMGWCINCHRETNVKIEGNPYYEKIHEQLSEKYGVEQLTAAQMGGLECGKCHY
ncbi:cytochrome C [Dokdonia sinensis]|uniref:Cytochrome C n=1 Tax=Dokdonia sinensis TaxID=2479847 RepID=A0A3M0G352_9FLAO|nr:c-type cytochrome [Dokdonia sinensis]RMB59195.1 cytochrome C [Dokdonia sinensis]